MKQRLKIALIATFATLVIVCSYHVTLLLMDPRSYSWYLVKNVGTSSHQLKPLPQTPGMSSRSFTLEFTPANIRGRAVCNYFSGVYRLDTATHTLSISAVDLTRAACVYTPAYRSEEEYTGLLQAANRYEANWRELRIYADTKHTVLVFQKYSTVPWIEQVLQQLDIWLRKLLS